MSNLVKINNQDLKVKVYKDQRVVTFKDIDSVHERPDGTAGRNFRENKKHFIEKQDFYYITGEELKEFKQTTNFVGSNAKELILITESGYLMLVKSFTDDLAWKVQRELVNSYFRVKEIVKPDGMKVISLLHAEVGELIAVTSQIENRVDKLENTMTIDYSQQEEIRSKASIRVVEILGGPDAPAYKELNKKAFSQIWKDYKRILNVNSYRNTSVKDFDKGINFVTNWEPSRELELMIMGSNSQMRM